MLTLRPHLQRPALAVVTCSLLVVGGSAIALTAGSNGATRPSLSHPSPPFPRTAGALTWASLHQMARTYPVLRLASEAATSKVARSLGPFELRRDAVPADGRVATMNSRGEALYVVPAKGSVCLTSSDRVVSGCSPYPAVAPDEVVGGTAVCAPGLPAGELEVALLLQGSPSNVVVHYSDGSSKAVSAPNGVVSVYSSRTGPLPTGVSWTGPSGAEEADSGVPPDAASTSCG